MAENDTTAKLVVNSVADIPDGPARRIFTATPKLTEIFDFALERSASPEAALAMIIAKVLVRTGPHMMIPDYVGSLGSLNFGVIAAGVSGGGKSTLTDVVGSSVSITAFGAGFQGDHLDAQPVEENLPLGTSAGLEEIFDQSAYRAYLAASDAASASKKGSDGKDSKDDKSGKKAPREVLRPADRAGFLTDEIAKLDSMIRKGDSSIKATLTSALTGGPLGATNKLENRRDVPSRSYRTCVTLLAQPALTGWILGDVASGFAQRWIWTPAVSGYTREDQVVENADPEKLRGSRRQPSRREEARTLDVVVPAEALERRDLPAGATTWMSPAADRDRIKMEFGEAAWTRIIQDHDRVAEDPMKAHENLTRAKVACGLALIHGRIDVADIDWDVAGELIAISDGVRELCADASADADQAVFDQDAIHRSDAKRAAEVHADSKMEKAIDLVARVAGGEFGHAWSGRGGARHNARRFREEADHVIEKRSENREIVMATEGRNTMIYSAALAPASALPAPAVTPIAAVPMVPTPPPSPTREAFDAEVANPAPRLACLPNDEDHKMLGLV